MTTTNNNSSSMPSFTFNGREKLQLPLDYTPTDDVFIIGRGKKVHNHPGNQQFRALIDATLPAYQQAPTKGLKSTLLWQVLTQVRRNTINGLGLVKKESGRWQALDDAGARINIAQAFRDRLSADYRSSKQHKSTKRKVELGLPVAEEELRVNKEIYQQLMSKRSNSIIQERPAKRTCLTSSDHSSLIEEMSMNDLRHLLTSARSSALPTTFFPTFLTEDKVKKDSSSKTFERLFHKFGGVDVSENPFEPNPIAAVVKPDPAVFESLLFDDETNDALFAGFVESTKSMQLPQQQQQQQQQQQHPISQVEEFEPLPAFSEPEKTSSLVASFSLGSLMGYFGGEQLERFSSIDKNLVDELETAWSNNGFALFA